MTVYDVAQILHRIIFTIKTISPKIANLNTGIYFEYPELWNCFTQ